MFVRRKKNRKIKLKVGFSDVFFFNVVWKKLIIGIRLFFFDFEEILVFLLKGIDVKFFF